MEPDQGVRGDPVQGVRVEPVQGVSLTELAAAWWEPSLSVLGDAGVNLCTDCSVCSKCVASVSPRGQSVSPGEAAETSHHPHMLYKRTNKCWGLIRDDPFIIYYSLI